MQQITLKREVEVNGHTYKAGSTYAVNASTFRDLLAAGGLKEAEAPAEPEAAADVLEVPKLQAEAQPVKAVRRTRKTRK